MLNDYAALKLAEIRQREDIAAAERSGLARQVAPANGHVPRIGGRWLVRPGAWLRYALQTSNRDVSAPVPEGECAG